MVEKRDLLIEIGTEELPPKALQHLARAFSEGLKKQLDQHRLEYGEVREFATPRRLAVLLNDVETSQQDRLVERTGPALRAAYDAEGNPTKAAEGFARSCGVAVSELASRETPKGSCLVYRHKEPGRQTTALIAVLVERSLAGLPIPKRMRWADKSEEFVRPVHWVLVLFGDQAVPCTILGLKAGGSTRGHRFHHPQAIEISRPGDYESSLLNQGKVYACFQKRRALISEEVSKLAESSGLRALVDDELLDEVTSLTEWPVPIMGEFDDRFLEVPSEALVKTMQEHQKYFPVLDDQGALTPRFITVANIASLDISQVRRGNERVIRPRFSDAAFFWEQDLKLPLEERVHGLKEVVFQKQLGTLYEKTERVSKLARHISLKLGEDPSLAERAALLSKCDLLSHMVGEFPSLQGTMGRHYAAKHGEPAEIAEAIEEQYLPRHAGDGLPSSPCGQALSLADRLDTLVGIFAIGQKPTGDKDPFGLRRAALGVLRILIESALDLDLLDLLKEAASNLQGRVDASAAVATVFDYVMERLRAYYSDREVPPDVVDAVLARRPTKPIDLDRRVHAVKQFKSLPEAESLASANKRIRNILRKSDEDIPSQASVDLLSEVSEKKLAERIDELGITVAPLFERGQYTEGLTALADLRTSVDDFFDDVMVMCDDPQLRRNRLALLSSLSSLFLKAADLSRLQ